MMLPMINEAVRCLDEAVVDTAVELDMALLLGLGLQQYLGGALKYADWLGLERVLTWSQRYGHLGPTWVTPQRVTAMATADRKRDVWGKSGSESVALGGSHDLIKKRRK